MSSSVAVRRKWHQPRKLWTNEELNQHPSGARNDYVELVRQYPRLILSIVDIPSKEDMLTWQKTDNYDGVLIMFDPIAGYENGVIMHPELDELVNIVKSFYDLFIFPEPQNKRTIQNFRQLNFMNGTLVFFHDYHLGSD